MVQLLMSALHKHLNEKPSMCDLLNTEVAHTQRTFCFHTAYPGLWAFTPEMFSYFLFCIGTDFFFPEVTALILVNCAQCHLLDIQTLKQPVELQLLAQNVCQNDTRIRVGCGQWSYML